MANPVSLEPSPRAQDSVARIDTEGRNSQYLEFDDRTNRAETGSESCDRDSVSNLRLDHSSNTRDMALRRDSRRYRGYCIARFG
jgi:hypothetical protein